MSNEWLTRVQAAAEYNIPRRTLDRWASLGEGPAFHRAGKRTLYLRKDVEHWLAGRRVEPRGAAR